MQRNIGGKLLTFIPSYTMKELMDNRDPDYLKHDKRTKELDNSKLHQAYASTCIYKTRSSKYSRNQITYTQWILFKDFIVLARDKEISLTESIKYSISHGDVHIACNCPAHRYWVYEYMATQLGYAYGTWRTNLAPKRNNTDLRGTVCKHMDKAIRQIMNDNSAIIKLFENYYGRMEEFPFSTNEVITLEKIHDAPNKTEGRKKEQKSMGMMGDDVFDELEEAVDGIDFYDNTYPDNGESGLDKILNYEPSGETESVEDDVESEDYDSLGWD